MVDIDPDSWCARVGAPKRAATTMMGNKATGGPFSPLVVVARNVIGEKDFNKIRGKAISLHSQGRSRIIEGGAQCTWTEVGPRGPHAVLVFGMCCG